MKNKSLLGLVWELATPKNISYFWGLGSFLSGVMITQIISGVLLAFYYVSGSHSWEAMVDISREVTCGWLLRLIHSNGASYVFIIMFIHFIRGLSYSSFHLSMVWLTGWAMLSLSMGVAFLGYVLPWGQMSFWGVTVIVNLLSVLPWGQNLVVWLWGGFYVSSFTCSFMFAMHFLLPMVIVITIIFHLAFLHYSGSSSPSGLSSSSSSKTKFSYLFAYKDVVNFIFLWMMWLWCFFNPEWSADPINFMPSDLSSSPIHIQPEWYFLHLYAILRSIPNKLGGLISFGMALVLFVTLIFTKTMQMISQFRLYNSMVGVFILINTILMWLGMQTVEYPFTFMGQISTLIYFIFFFKVFLWNLLMLTSII